MDDLQCPALFAFDAAVAAPPADLRFEHHQTGYWFFDSDEALPVEEQVRAVLRRAA